MMQQERRSSIRKTLNPLPYINLPSNNGGIVLDVSEHGLRFRALAPVEHSGPIHFYFSAHSNLIAGTADLVWTDAARKTGGLRFTNLSDDAVKNIRRWPHESTLRPSIGADLTLHITSTGESSRARAASRGGFEAVLQRASAWLGRHESALRDSARDAIKFGWAELNSLWSKNRWNEWHRNAGKAIAAAAVVLMISAFSYFHYRSAGERVPQTIAPPPAVNVSDASPLAGSPSTGPLQSSGSQEQPAVTPPPTSAAAVTPDENASASPAGQSSTANGPLRKRVTSAGELVVQVAALTRAEDARKLADSLKHENFQAFVRTLPVDAYYRVMIGPYANEQSAGVVVGNLKRAGINSFIRREPVVEQSYSSSGVATP
jgi:cell division septation protein DedD